MAVHALAACAVGALVALAVWLLLGGGGAAARLSFLASGLRRTAGSEPGRSESDRRGAGGDGAEHSGSGGVESSTGGSRDRLRRRRDGRGRRHRAPDPEEAAIAVVDRCAELLRAGVPPVRAVSHIAGLGTDAPLAAALGRIARALELGESPHSAIRRHSGGLDSHVADVLDGMAAVWLVAESSGAPAAEMLSEYGNSCRLRADSRREREVALAGPQSTVKVLTWLPVISLGLSLVIGANPLRLVVTPAGFATLAAGIALLVAGRLWMRALLRAAQ